MIKRFINVKAKFLITLEAMNPFFNGVIFSKSIVPTKLASWAGLVLLKHDNGTALAIAAILSNGVPSAMFEPKLLAIDLLIVLPLLLRAAATVILSEALICSSLAGFKNDIYA